jgi:hypothetical protein
MLSTSSGLTSWSLSMSLQGVTTQNTIFFTDVFLSLSTTVNKRHRFTTVGYNVVCKNMILKETPKMKGFLKVSIQSFSNFSTALQLWISKWHIPFLPGLLIVVERNNFMSIPSFNGLWTDAYGEQTSQVILPWSKIDDSLHHGGQQLFHWCHLIPDKE